MATKALIFLKWFSHYNLALLNDSLHKDFHGLSEILPTGLRQDLTVIDIYYSNLAIGLRITHICNSILLGELFFEVFYIDKRIDSFMNSKVC